MKSHQRRITLISRDPLKVDRDWNRGPLAPSRMITVDSFTVLRGAMSSGFADFDADVERVVLDRTATASDFLSLLAELPHQFRGDVLFIRQDDSAFVSSTGRGGDRLVYALSSTDLRFYLETHGLVTGTTTPVASPALPLSVPTVRFTYLAEAS